ncbi:MAG: hypothetical protein K8R59_04665 [Thermoanaerobaculales bacterium]|nr:hypothetical protein [Thermoanaerobaculales bacterium]
MFDHLLNDQQRQLRDEVRAFVKSVLRQLILDMELDACESGAEDEKIYD